MICNMDCGHCIFDDCINDELSLADYKEDVIGEEVPREVQMARNRCNKYVANHREECNQRSINYYYENSDKCKKSAKKWQKENRERYNASKRDYRARKKAERVS